MQEDREYRNSKYYTNREQSWVLFNRRVLEEAEDESIPLFDRLKFLGITASNLDEFFMVRMASLKDLIAASYNGQDISGLTAKQQFKALVPMTHELVEDQYAAYRSLTGLLNKCGLRLIQHHEDLSEDLLSYVDEYFQEKIYPVLTPMAVDSSRPFPLVRNKTLNLGALLKRKKTDKKGLISSDEDETDFALVQVPDVLPRVVELPDTEINGEKVRRVIFLEEIIERNIGSLFLNYEVLCVHPFRIMRNADFTLDEDETEDLLKEIERKIKKRQWGHAIRLEIEKNPDEHLLKLLEKELSVSDDDIYMIDGPLDLTVMSKVYKLSGFEQYKAKGFVPQTPAMFDEEEDLYRQIADKDRLLMLPYERFDPVVEFIRQASKDEKTLAIKMTLYRVSGNSPIVAALAQAAENGKQVTVLVELKARFDEENNIVWARKLEQAGCHVIYGLVGLKTHSKIALVVRQEEDGIKRYVHLGTGNYNDVTARLYTDMGIFTAREQIGEDATAVFNMLSGYSEPLSWNALSVAPLWLKDKFLSLIKRETENARFGRRAEIVAKMNSVCDIDIMAALYEASSQGVKIKLIVRGICCLKTGIKGVSDNIEVRSIVGDFLEHSRIFWFANGGNEELYMGSADWMPRNLERRVEILFPVLDEDIKEELKEYLRLQLKDNVKARVMEPDGSYTRHRKEGDEYILSQDICCRRATLKAKSLEDTALEGRVFIPVMRDMGDE